MGVMLESRPPISFFDFAEVTTLKMFIQKGFACRKRSREKTFTLDTLGLHWTLSGVPYNKAEWQTL